MKNLINTLGKFILLFIFFSWLESGLNFSDLRFLLQPLIFAFLTILLFKRPVVRFLFFLMIGFSILLMIVFYVFNLINLSAFFGSNCLALLLILIFFYLPQMVKKGYIEKV